MPESQSIHLIMTTDVKKNDTIFKLNIDNSYIPRDRESSLTGKLASQRMVEQRSAQLTRYKQGEPFFELCNQFCIRTDPLFEVFFKRPVAFDLLHGYRSFMKSSTVSNGPDRLMPFFASSAALFKRAAAISLGSPHSSISRSILRPSTAALIITLRYACAESKPSCLARAVNFLRTDGSKGIWIVDVLLMNVGYQRDIIMSTVNIDQPILRGDTVRLEPLIARTSYSLPRSWRSSVLFTIEAA